MNLKDDKHYHSIEKPTKCPVCGGNKIEDIGFPHFCSQTDEKLKNHEIILGGCCMIDEAPVWECTQCHTHFYQTIPTDELNCSTHDIFLSMAK